MRKYQTLCFLTILPAIKYTHFVIVSDEYGNPINRYKTYKIQTIRIMKFVLSAHFVLGRDNDESKLLNP